MGLLAAGGPGLRASGAALISSSHEKQSRGLLETESFMSMNHSE